VGMRRNRGSELVNTLRLEIQLDERTVGSAPPRVSEGIKAPALRGHHVRTAIQVKYFPGRNFHDLEGVAPVCRPTPAPIFSVIRNRIVVGAVCLQGPLLQDLAGIGIHLYDQAVPTIPNVTVGVQSEITEAGSIDRSRAINFGLLHVACLGIE